MELGSEWVGMALGAMFGAMLVSFMVVVVFAVKQIYLEREVRRLKATLRLHRQVRPAGQGQRQGQRRGHGGL